MRLTTKEKGVRAGVPSLTIGLHPDKATVCWKQGKSKIHSTPNLLERKAQQQRPWAPSPADGTTDHEGTVPYSTSPGAQLLLDVDSFYTIRKSVASSDHCKSILNKY